MPGKNHFKQNWMSRQISALRRGQSKLGEKVGKTNTKITKPVVRLFRGVTNTLAEFGSSFGGVFAAIKGTVLRPFRAISVQTSKKSSEIEKKLQEAKVQGIRRFRNIGIVAWFSDTVRSVSSGISSSWTLVTTKIYKSPFLRALLFPLILLGRATVYTYEFLAAWFRTRRFIRLIGTIPAILLVIPVAYYTVRIPFHSNSAIAGVYRKALLVALNEKDVELAQFLSRKLAQIGEDSPRQIFDKVIFAWRSEEVEESLRLLAELTPDDGSGYPSAYAWKAERIMDGTIEFEDPAQLNATLENCLRLAADAFPDDGLTGHWLAALYAGTERQKEAVEVLDKIDISKQTPAMQIPIATMYHSWGNPQKARRIAGDANRRYGRIDRDQLKANDFLYWSTARQMMMDVEGSFEILLEGYATIKERSIEHGLSKSEVEKLTDEKRKELESQKEKNVATLLTHSIKLGMTVLENARQNGNMDQWMSIAKMILDAPHSHHELQTPIVYGIKDFNGERVETLLKPYLESGRLTPMAHIHYAQIKFSQGNIELARTAYEQIHQYHPENIDVVNNLAWIYSHFEPLDIDRALVMANQAVKAMPNHAGFRETRGQVYVLMERWDLAIADLEFALNGLGQNVENAEIHRSLSKCYTQIGNERLANLHLDRFRSLQVSN